MRLVCKLALYTEEKVFGEGPFELLSRVEGSGSLRRAAAEMGMSYTKAWRLVRLEQRLGFALLERHVGGSAGGGSGLTPEAEDLLRRYGAFYREAAAALDALFAAHFGDSWRGSGRMCRAAATVVPAPVDGTCMKAPTHRFILTIPAGAC